MNTVIIFAFGTFLARNKCLDFSCCNNQSVCCYMYLRRYMTSSPSIAFAHSNLVSCVQGQSEPECKHLELQIFFA